MRTCMRRLAARAAACAYLHVALSTSTRGGGGGGAHKASTFPCASVADCLNATLWHIPGPNPIVSPWSPDPAPCAPKSSEPCKAGWHCATCKDGATNPSDCLSCAGGYVFAKQFSDCTGTCTKHGDHARLQSPRGAAKDWAAVECEVAGGVMKFNDTYYFIYHCTGFYTSYQVGISTAKHPLGPWTRPPLEPNLAISPAPAWDNNVVASFNIMADPDPAGGGGYLGWYEGGMGTDTPGGHWESGKWSLGLARAATPLGPWVKHAGNPILQGKEVCDTNRTFDGKTCNGLYVASVLFGAHTNHEYWLYVEAPINQNDEGPIALWTAKKPEGPFTFKAYVLDGGSAPPSQTRPARWDAGRYSESRVWYFGGLFHLFATGSSQGNPRPDKVNEQIGWAISKDGIHFQEYPHNPVAPYTSSTPHTQAMSEGHVWLEEPLIYVYHTIRWDDSHDSFAQGAGRNLEDLGVEIFSPSPKFKFDMPIITHVWGLHLQGGEESPCAYNKTAYRYCVPLKAIITSTGSERVLQPTLAFTLKAHCTPGMAAPLVHVYRYTYLAGPGATMASLQVRGSCADGMYTGSTIAREFPTDWVVATVQAGVGAKSALKELTVDVEYASR